MQRPRYTDRPLPPYSYVPRHFPHPVSDPRGHMHGRPATSPEPLTETCWANSHEYLYAVDLFNHGFYWEAHEAWEALWLAAGRRGRIADWLKGLIKLAAALVKLREGSAVGALRHALRVEELVDQVEQDGDVAADRYCGLRLATVRELARQVIVVAERGPLPPAPRAVINDCLELG